MDALAQAIRLYEALIEDLAEDSNRHFGALGDPLFEGARFYTFEDVAGSFDFNDATELGGERVDEIEEWLMQVESSYSLMSPLLKKLASVAERFNANGKTVFLSPWGGGPAEIGWLIRRINDRMTFETYLRTAGLKESDVDVYNEGFERELNSTDDCGRALND